MSAWGQAPLMGSTPLAVEQHLSTQLNDSGRRCARVTRGPRSINHCLRRSRPSSCSSSMPMVRTRRGRRRAESCSTRRFRPCAVRGAVAVADCDGRAGARVHAGAGGRGNWCTSAPAKKLTGSADTRFPPVEEKARRAGRSDSPGIRPASGVGGGDDRDRCPF